MRERTYKPLQFMPGLDVDLEIYKLTAYLQVIFFESNPLFPFWIYKPPLRYEFSQPRKFSFEWPHRLYLAPRAVPEVIPIRKNC